ncbi:unnamed protein product [Bursaphelenchus okinawaensis]|uniref:Uncharacterized protein n=1 Tax=Bursaphelenchus okinawaensis TaxID=465554 RepID=A0A811LEC0_9BILA|nr:unnamed protein product [Bursaphelenchus okinawaensis]CAG9121002.1 unnamed protein product [Bursaphelenchus okinawaensis]
MSSTATTTPNSSAGSLPASTSSGSTLAVPSSASVLEASFLPIGYFNEKNKEANPAPIKNKVCLKKARQQGRYAKVHKYLDGIERELELLKVKQLSCCTKRQKENISFEADQILAKCAVIKEGIFGKTPKQEAMKAEVASTSTS